MDEIFIKWLNIYDEFREGSALRDIYQADIINIGRILDLLDAEDDVQEVYHNWDE